MLVSAICYALAIATFFLVDKPWYFALPIAFAVFIGTSVVRSLWWSFIDQRMNKIIRPEAKVVGASLSPWGSPEGK